MNLRRRLIWLIVLLIGATIVIYFWYNYFSQYEG